ncbi:hypothetical protein COU58_03500 [Candidatus Pacearchaeota archaeon CG10_big_fil_rev_8_21_14_0_10_32_42]|nr:MAG: hypothetical protein COU58_03500 [Candidatus Pacearchaeota archaeon CG10_big_fil_rev_8_21_14_0_10_32_42]
MVEIPIFNEEDQAQICLIRKYRTTNGEEKKTNYSFFKIGVHKKISDEIKGWLSENFKKIENKNIIEYNPSVEMEELEKVELNGLEVWKEFEEKAFSGFNFQEIDLTKLKTHLSGIIIFIKKGDEVYGQIRKVTRANILDRKGWYTLFFGKDKFNDLIEEKGIRLDKGADFIFYCKKEKCEGIILDKSNFKSIFDLWEEYKKKAIVNTKEIKLFKENEYSDSFYKIVEEDRIIQKMLINPAFEKYLNEIDYSDLKSLKQEVPNIGFDLNEETQNFVLPVGKEKDAIRDLIKVISGRFGRSINNQHIIENSGVRRVLK